MADRERSPRRDRRSGGGGLGAGGKVPVMYGKRIDLQAQVLYRLEQYDQCYSVYKLTDDKYYKEWRRASRRWGWQGYFKPY